MHSQLLSLAHHYKRFVFDLNTNLRSGAAVCLLGWLSSRGLTQIFLALGRRSDNIDRPLTISDIPLPAKAAFHCHLDQDKTITPLKRKGKIR